MNKGSGKFEDIVIINNSACLPRRWTLSTGRAALAHSSSPWSFEDTVAQNRNNQNQASSLQQQHIHTPVTKGDGQFDDVIAASHSVPPFAPSIDRRSDTFEQNFTAEFRIPSLQADGGARRARRRPQQTTAKASTQHKPLLALLDASYVVANEHPLLTSPTSVHQFPPKMNFGDGDSLLDFDDGIMSWQDTTAYSDDFHQPPSQSPSPTSIAYFDMSLDDIPQDPDDYSDVIVEKEDVQNDGFHEDHDAKNDDNKDDIVAQNDGPRSHVGGKRIRDLMRHYKTMYANTSRSERTAIPQEENDDEEDTAIKEEKDELQAKDTAKNNVNQGIPDMDYITSNEAISDKQVKEHDVLCGPGIRSHVGNGHFRDLLAQSKEVYATADRNERTAIAQRIVSLIRVKGGRFLQRDGEKWMDIGLARAIQKTRSALVARALPSTVTTTKRQIPVKKVTKYDVLCGKSSDANGHVGTHFYRDQVLAYQDEYAAAEAGCKCSVAWKIVNTIREKEGRFLKKIGKKKEWYDIGEKEAFKKTRKALCVVAGKRKNTTTTTTTKKRVKKQRK